MWTRRGWHAVQAATGGNGHSRTARNGQNGQATRSTRTISFAEAVKLMIDEGRAPKLRYEYWAPKTQPLGTGGDMHFAFCYAVHAALVSVDVETGEVAVERVISAHDVGRAINPLSLTGQIEGGIVMGIGNALTEHYIEENGVPWTRHLGQYKMPGIKHAPAMTNFVVEHAAPDGPYGAKGVGEISSIPISPAITNAIYNAVGVRCLALPVDQDALLLAMKHGQQRNRPSLGRPAGQIGGAPRWLPELMRGPNERMNRVSSSVSQGIRKEYRRGSLQEADANPDPIRHVWRMAGRWRWRAGCASRMR